MGDILLAVVENLEEEFVGLLVVQSLNGMAEDVAANILLIITNSGSLLNGLSLFLLLDKLIQRRPPELQTLLLVEKT